MRFLAQGTTIDAGDLPPPERALQTFAQALVPSVARLAAPGGGASCRPHKWERPADRALERIPIPGDASRDRQPHQKTWLGQRSAGRVWRRRHSPQEVLMARSRLIRRIKGERAMPHPTYRLLSASLIAVAVALLTLPLTVAAAPPEVETFHNEGSFTFAGPCPNGVTLVETFTEDVRVTTFFDNQGTAVRVQITDNYVGVVTNPVTGASVEDPSHQTTTIDLVTGTETDVGLIFSSTVPGVGVVFHDVGRVVLDAEGNVTFEAGPHDVLHTEGPHAVRARFCAALT